MTASSVTLPSGAQLFASRPGRSLAEFDGTAQAREGLTVRSLTAPRSRSFGLLAHAGSDSRPRWIYALAKLLSMPVCVARIACRGPKSRINLSAASAI